MSELVGNPQPLETRPGDSWGLIGKFAVTSMLATSLLAPEVVPPALPTLHSAVTQAEQFALPPTDRATCVPPPAGDITSVTKLVEGFQSPEYNAVWQTGPTHLDDGLAGNYQDEDQRMYNLDKKAATSLGLTVHDPVPFRQPLYKDMTHATQTLPTATYLHQAQEFLQEYGIDLRTATASDKLYYNMQPPTAAEFDSPTTKRDLYDLIAFIAHLPAEDVKQLVGLKHILLAGNSHAGAAAYGNYGDGHNTIVMNVNYDDHKGAVYGHEVGHLRDFRECGGYQALMHNQAFMSYDFGQVYKKGPHAKTLEGWVPTTPLGGTSPTNKSTETPEQVCAKKAAFDSVPKIFDVSLPDNYSATSPAEAQAQFQEKITDRLGLMYMTAITTPPRVVDKYIEQLAELYNVSPALAKYYLLTQQRTATNYFGVCANPSVISQQRLVTP